MTKPIDGFPTVVALRWGFPPESYIPLPLSRKVGEGRLVDECQSIKSWSLLPPSGIAHTLGASVWLPSR